MNVYKNQTKLASSIKNATPEELLNYHFSLLELLGKIDVNTCDDAFLEHLKMIFELLMRLHPGERHK